MITILLYLIGNINMVLNTLCAMALIVGIAAYLVCNMVAGFLLDKDRHFVEQMIIINILLVVYLGSMFLIYFVPLFMMAILYLALLVMYHYYSMRCEAKHMMNCTAFSFSKKYAYGNINEMSVSQTSKYISRCILLCRYLKK